ncbi:hypothetical protein N7466_010723 [Penicillium verhagenii]|uniref:uncharacterized protein n=1 Tax=Penicillium verhagenii TaxID=1562060 RepID=UPI002545B286|nr:uncharacterized protein N7466_010723 [Penicillium verhagenii]KAJ5917169.1 hypothetical protein N7466_010723 [Penicillium verhagenii]
MSTTIPTVKRRACVACTAVKAKCTPQAVNLCQRCARLDKPCTYLDLPQTKRRHKATPSRVEVLERKVEQLLSQLEASTRQNGRTLSVVSNSFPTNSGLGQVPELNPREIEALFDAAKDPSHGLDLPTDSVLEGQPSIVDRGLLSQVEAEHLLTTFQIDLVPKFPFVVLPRGETASRLRHQTPFLFLCVVAATIGSAHPLRQTISEEIMKHLNLRVVERSERNMELLRGLLVHSAWYSYPAERYHPRLLLLMQFCISILYDLGLHKKPGLSLDEQRALLGVYWLSVGVCGTLGRPIIMKHDDRIKECIQSMASTEQLSDRWIAPLIHLQAFLATMDEVYASLRASGGRALVQVTHGSLQHQFDSLRESLEKNLSACPSSTVNAIRIEIKYVEIRLHELAIHEELWITEPTSAVRTNMLIGMIQQSKELIRAIRNLPSSEISQMTITTSAHICATVGYFSTAVLSLLNLITGFKESCMESQVQAVVDAADYPNLLTGLANTLETRFEGMSAVDKEAEILGSLCSKLRLLARCYPYQVKAIVGISPLQAAGHEAPMIAALTNGNARETEAWPSIYSDLGDILPVDEIQWDSLLGGFTGFN